MVGMKNYVTSTSRRTSLDVPRPTMGHKFTSPGFSSHGWRKMDGPGRFWSRREESGTPAHRSRSSAYQFHAVIRFRVRVILCCAYSGPLPNVYSLSEVHSPCLGSACSAYVAIPHVYKDVLHMMPTHTSTSSDERTAVKSWQLS